MKSMLFRVCTAVALTALVISPALAQQRRQTTTAPRAAQEAMAIAIPTLSPGTEPKAPVTIETSAAWKQDPNYDYNLSIYVIVKDFTSGRPLDDLGSSRGNGNQVITLPEWWRIHWFDETCVLDPSLFINKSDGVYQIWFERRSQSNYSCQNFRNRQFVLTLMNSDRAAMGSAFVAVVAQ